MNIYKEKSREFFDRADYLYSKFSNIPHYTDTIDALCTDIKEYENIRIFNSSMHGLICEYYLKGMLLPLLDIIYKNLDEYKPIRSILNTLTEEEKYNLLIGNTKETINNLSIESNEKKELLKVLKVNNISSGSHNLSKILRQIVSNYEKIKVSVEKELDIIIEELAQMPDEVFLRDDYKEDERLHLLTDIDDFLERLRSFPQSLAWPLKHSYYTDVSQKYSKLCTKDINFETLLEVLEKANINNAFSEGRYGNLKIDYDLDSDLLYEIMISLQIESSFYDRCVLLVNNDYIKRIYPDINSKIYMIKDDKIERVYKYEHSSCFFDRITSNSKEIIIPKYYRNIGCTPEYGLDQILENLSPLSKIDFNISNHISIDNMNIICFYQNNELKILYKRVFSDLNRDTSDIENVIHTYENSIKYNTLYSEQEKILNLFKEQNKEKEKTLKKVLS